VVTVVVDSSKFAAHAMFRVAPISAVDQIVTNRGTPRRIIRALERLKIEVLLA